MKTAVSGTSEPYQILEKKWAKFTGSKYAVSCNSGTAALHLALLALGIGPGDEVIVPDFTMAAVAFAVSYTGAKPVFSDIEMDTYGIDYKNMYPLINSNTKAIILVHTYGRLAKYREKIFEMARAAQIPVIEDACEAQGAVKNSKAFMTCYSFFKNKIIAAEEGGIITTNSRAMQDKINYLKNMAFSPEHDYFHRAIGYNYRMANTQAKLALESLKKYKYNSRRRKYIQRWYNEYFALHQRDAVWFYDVIVELPIKEWILKNIPGARNSFKPLSSFPMYGSNIGQACSKFISSNLVLLPANPKMTKKEVIKICKSIKNAF